MKSKKCDCVEMKRDIQDQLRREFEGLEPAEVRAAQRRLLESDPDLARFLERVAEARSPARRPRE